MVEVVRIKARSKASKLRSKRRGRPRAEGVIREPNGRKSRSKIPMEAIDKLAIAMRAKHTGVTIKEAKDPRAETYIGRLNMKGVEGGLSDAQYDAAIKFIEIDNNFKQAVNSPSAHYDTYFTLNNDENYEQFCKRAKKQYEDAWRAIKEEQFDNKTDNLLAAVQYVIIENLELPHLIWATRQVLNALSRHFACINRVKNNK